MRGSQPEQRNGVEFVDLSAQYQRIRPEIESAIAAVMGTSDFILGSAVERFEQEFARFCGAKYGVGVDSGMSALELALRAHGIGPEDEVITAANSFVASAFAISHVGAKPVLVDVCPETATLDVGAVRAAISPSTAAIMPVHLYGQPADMDPILDLAARHALLVVEDACQAHGARYKGRHAGALGHSAAFSFYPGKNLGAYGDGGMVVTGDAAVADTVRRLRNYGQDRKYHHVHAGYNKRLDTLQAAVLEVKLKYLDSWNAARRRHATLYTDLLRNAGVITPTSASWNEHVWHLYAIETDQRDTLATFLRAQGIATGIHYPIPIHLQPAYESLGYEMGSFPVTEARAKRLLSLPMYAELTAEDIARVSEAIQAFHAGITEQTTVAMRCASSESPTQSAPPARGM